MYKLVIIALSLIFSNQFPCLLLPIDDNRLQEVYDNRRGLKYQDMVDRDKHRFNSADQDNDGKLSRDEFAIFLHPEDTPYMREVVILETLQDMDDDKDGAVSLEEYISMYLSIIIYTHSIIQPVLNKGYIIE